VHELAGGFRFLEHTADAYVEVWGETLEELFEYAAISMFEVMVDTRSVEPKYGYDVKVSGMDLENLMYKWLEEWLIIHSIENVVFSKFKVFNIVKGEENTLTILGKGWGEPLDYDRHDVKTEVKAVTYSNMMIRKMDGKWLARIVFDI